MSDTWIESHSGLYNHLKTRKAAAALKISQCQLIGHLHCLWWWAIDEAEDGDLSKMDDAAIAMVSQWEGDPNEFVTALRECRKTIDGDGFITSENKLTHWQKYTGKLIERRQKDAERKRTSRDGTRDGYNQSNGCPPDIQQTSDGCPRDGVRNRNRNRTVPYRTVPELSNPPVSINIQPVGFQSQTDSVEARLYMEIPGSNEPKSGTEQKAKVPAPRKPALPKHEPAAFHEFYLAYPRADDPADASRAWDSVQPDAAAITSIMDCLRRFGGKRLSKELAVKCKAPGAWLRSTRWTATDPFPGLTIEQGSNGSSMPVGASGNPNGTTGGTIEDQYDSMLSSIDRVTGGRMP
jgi:hypothetical protein